MYWNCGGSCRATAFYLDVCILWQKQTCGRCWLIEELVLFFSPSFSILECIVSVTDGRLKPLCYSWNITITIYHWLIASLFLRDCVKIDIQPSYAMLAQCVGLITHWLEMHYRNHLKGFGLVFTIPDRLFFFFFFPEKWKKRWILEATKKPNLTTKGLRRPRARGRGTKF